MSKQGARMLELAGEIQSDWEPLTKVPGELEAETLLEVGLLCVLTRNLSEAAAAKTLKGLKKAYPDWNELRVSQIQEFLQEIGTKSGDVARTVANDVKAYLHEVFLKNHGFDLEFLRADPGEAARFFTQLLVLGPGPAHYVMWSALEGSVPVSLGLIRVLHRAGLMKRTSSVKKAGESLDKWIPEKDRPRFGVRFGALTEFCDTKKPSCWECALRPHCPFGKKVYADWQAQQKRLAQQRAREEEARRKAEERERKRAEAEAKKRSEKLAREQAKQRKIQERQAKADARKQEAARKKAEAAAKKVQRAKELAKKQAAAKKAAAKQAAAKKAAAKKAAAKKAAAKKAASKKAGSKTAASKKKAGAKKKASKKAAAKKPAAKKKTAKKPATKKKATKRPAAKKTTAKKPAAKKKATKKKTTKKRR